jgi:hypothetical protein
LKPATARTNAGFALERRAGALPFDLRATRRPDHQAATLKRGAYFWERRRKFGLTPRALPRIRDNTIAKAPDEHLAPRHAPFSGARGFHLFCLLAISGSSQSADPVETNKLAAEAEALIHKQFDPDDCAVVMFAEKTQDGTIDAVCNNGEAFRVTSKMALRCAAMEHL